MRLANITVLLLAAATANADNIVINGPGVTQYRFVGFSTIVVAGDVGIIGLYDACQIDFRSATARACFSDEAIRDPDVFAEASFADGEGAWLMPVVTGASPAMDVSGVGDDSRFDLSCAYWRGGVVTGLAISGHQVDGGELVQTIQLLSCGKARPVTCCDVKVASLDFTDNARKRRRRRR